MRWLLFTTLCLELLLFSGCGSHVSALQPTRLTEETVCTIAGEEAEPSPPSYESYAAFGLRYDGDTDALYFHEERVRYFWDGVDTGNGGQIARVEHIDEAGTVDVHTVRETISNGDGSVNPFGPLTGLEPFSQEEFDARDLEALSSPALAETADGGESSGPPGMSFAERFEPYREYGVEFILAAEGGGTGNVYFLGEPVNAFADISEAGTFVFHSLDGGSCNVRTVYDRQGSLSGVERVTGGITPEDE